MRKLCLVLALLSASCGSSAPPPAPPGAPVGPTVPSKDDPFGLNGDPGPSAPVARFARLDRASFNKAAVRLNVPVYWKADANKNGEVEPGEVAGLLFFGKEPPAWTKAGQFTPAFEAVYEDLVAKGAPKNLDARQQKLLGELDEANSSLVLTKTAGFSPEEKAFLTRMLKVAGLVDALYEKQLGLDKLRDKVGADALSASVFRRNWGPGCKTPRFESDKECSALTKGGEAAVDVWPAARQQDKDFCKKIETEKNAKELSTPFAVVREKDGKLVAEGYDKAYGPEMRAIASELRDAAKELKDPSEKALVAYLNAAAKAFETNKWEPADEAWAKMNARNSKWYLRVAPDETYWEPCSLKAGFHMSFARINKDSLKLQDQLTPLQQQMEDDLAKLIGAPYKARKVSFHLPDFIDIVVNAGDSRDAIGATIGQSLPNWGPVANQGRGRTVAMTNLYADPDSLVVRRKKAESVLVSESMTRYAEKGNPGLFATVLHEATHNLGPSHEYTVGGKKDDEAFGGDLASMMEENKAQSGAYFYLGLTQDKGVVDQKAVEETIVDNVVWSLNHISRGMYAPNGQRKAYSQLAAVHVGFLTDAGALVWDPKAKAANGSDTGAYRVDFSKFRAASVELMKTVAGIKARGDKDAALALAKKYVDSSERVPHELIKERMLRFPQPNFVYAVEE